MAAPGHPWPARHRCSPHRCASFLSTSYAGRVGRRHQAQYRMCRRRRRIGGARYRNATIVQKATRPRNRWWRHRCASLCTIVRCVRRVQCVAPGVQHMGLLFPPVVVLSPPALVILQRLPSAQGAKYGYITPKDCLSP